MKNKHHRARPGSEVGAGLESRSRYRGRGQAHLWLSVDDQKKKRDLQFIREHGTKAQRRDMKAEGLL